MIRSVLLILLFGVCVNSLGQEDFLFEPTGEYSIGTLNLYLVDSSRREPVKKSYKGFRRIFVKVWYPSDVKEGLVYNKYLSSYDAEVIYDIFKIKKVSIEQIKRLKQYDTHSCEGIELATSDKPFPVILFNAGYYFGMTDLYSNYMEMLASHGYIVFSVIHPYHQPLVYFPDGDAKLLKKKSQVAFLEWKLRERVKIKKITNEEIQAKFTKRVLKNLKQFGKTVNLWTIDNQFVLDYLVKMNQAVEDPFYGKIDLDRIGIFGQSLGGAVAGQMAHVDARIKAAINIDCFQFGDVVDQDLQTPLMLIESEFDKKWIIGNEYIYSQTKSDFYSLIFPNTTHFICSDVPVIPVLTEEQQTSFCGKVDGEKILAEMNAYILDFFNHYLKGISSALLKEELMRRDMIYQVR